MRRLAAAARVARAGEPDRGAGRDARRRGRPALLAVRGPGPIGATVAAFLAARARRAASTRTTAARPRGRDAVRADPRRRDAVRGRRRRRRAACGRSPRSPCPARPATAAARPRATPASPAPRPTRREPDSVSEAVTDPVWDAVATRKRADPPLRGPAARRRRPRADPARRPSRRQQQEPAALDVHRRAATGRTCASCRRVGPWAGHLAGAAAAIALVTPRPEARRRAAVDPVRPRPGGRRT